MFKQTMIWTAAALATAALGMACDNNAASSKAAPTSAPATAAAPPATVTNTNAVAEVDPLANVANRDQLTADPNATKIDPPKSAVLVTGLSTTVRQSPRGSKIKVIETTATVKEIERDGNYILVTFSDPKNPSQMLAGWVYRDSLVGEAASSTATPGAARATGKLACAMGESHLRTTQDFCGKTCDDDRDCDSKRGQVCDGIGFKINEKTDAHTDARYCISDSAAADGLHGAQHGASDNLPVR